MKARLYTKPSIKEGTLRGARGHGYREGGSNGIFFSYFCFPKKYPSKCRHQSSMSPIEDQTLKAH